MSRSRDIDPFRALTRPPGEAGVPAEEPFPSIPERPDVARLAGTEVPGSLGLSIRMDRGSAVVELRGKLLESMDAELRRTLNALLETGVVRVVVDCSRLDFLASRGVSVLIALMDAFRAGNGDLRLAAAPPQAKLVLERLGVTLVMRHFGTVEEAIRSYGDPIEAPPPPPAPNRPPPKAPPAPLPRTVIESAAPADRRKAAFVALVALVLFFALTSAVLLVLLLRTRS